MIANKYKNREIILEEEDFQKQNPFLVWKDICNSNNLKFIALIPFCRNLIQYSLGEEENDYKILTSVLHIKSETFSINVKIIKDIVKKYWVKEIDSKFDNINIFDFIIEEINNRILKWNIIEKELETKITLSIWIRLLAEKFMINKIADQKYVDSITNIQTYKLFKKVCEDKLVTNDEEKILDKVNMLTAENIHINAFMYEPIIDLWIDSLIELYWNVKRLK